MNRPVKFKVWLRDGLNSKSGRWLENHEFNVKADGTVATYGVYAHKNQLELAEFTGRYDLKGKEIYEGDIMEDTDWGNGIVAWDAPNAQWILDCKHDWTALHNTKMEVLGNIFENPELL